jgi:hypothetical protein
MADELNARVERLDESERRAWAAIKKLDDVLVVIAEAHAKLAEAQLETEKRFQQTDARFQQTDARSRQVDERIDKLMSAIGELIRRQDSH